MGARRRDRTILGIGAIQLPEELRPTLVDSPPQMEEVDEDEEPSRYGSWVGRVIGGRYRLEELIAEGGMGAVFASRHVDGGPRVALKVMHAELGDNDAIVQRFAREVEIGRRLRHEHIVGALDTGTMEDGSAYLVLEYVTGPSLSIAMWEDEQFEWRRAARIGAQIADALAASWAAGIVHRDLKPDNVVLEPGGAGGETVKVLDFGIAHDRSVTDDGAKLTMLGEVLGTVGYMAPEQTLGQPVDARCDLYTLGILLWEMLAGVPLFDEDLTHAEFLKVQIAEPPTPIRELAPETPRGLADLVHRLLAYAKPERPADAESVRDELLRLLGEAPAGDAAADPSAPARVDDAGGAAASSPPQATATRPAAPESAPAAGAAPDGPADPSDPRAPNERGLPSRETMRRAPPAPPFPRWPIFVGLGLAAVAGLALLAAAALLLLWD